MAFIKGHGLGAIQPETDKHIQLWRAGAVLPEAAPQVERTLDLPKQYIPHYDQGVEGACVGFSLSWNMSILNRRRYNARALYLRAQQVDEWPGEDYSGTSVNAGCKVLMLEGHWRLQKSRWWATAREFLGLEQGIAAYRWAVKVDEVRTANGLGIPVTFSTPWFASFDSPVYINNEWWIGAYPKTTVGAGVSTTVAAPLDNLGAIRGYHAITEYAASDRRQANRYVNTWGFDYVRPWMLYEIEERMLRNGDAQAALITDR